MTDLTILTPIAPHHLAAFAQAEASVLHQTVSVLHFAMLDQHGRGPGYIRNRLLEKVTTPYVSFLDSDDWLEPNFAEVMLRYAREGFYLFSDWLQDGQRIKASARPWCEGKFHLISGVVPTIEARAVGGFDETLSGMEDTDFWLKLLKRGVCGVRVPRPLVNYRKGGGRSHALHESGEIKALRAEIDRRYGGVRMGCCGDTPPLSNAPTGERQANDVLAQAQWGGNREQMGMATGRRYPRTSFPKTLWVDRRDIAAAPHHWRQMPEEGPPDIPEDDSELRGVAALVQSLTQMGKLKPAPPVVPAKPGPIAVTPNPNFARVRELVEQSLGHTISTMEWDVQTGESVSVEPGQTVRITPTMTSKPAIGDPVFVMPANRYPSYSDFWKLVELAGFATIYGDQINMVQASEDRRHTFIFTGPDGIPDCSAWPARTIFWQLEYVGDYTQQANINTVDEIWSSDPTHAARTGAKYVLLGSDKRLNKHWNKVKPKPKYDIVTLAYLTDRRRAIYDQLRNDYTFAPDYPGHDGQARHDILRRSRLMLHVHQHDTPAHTPLRYALAAAYRLPMISEFVPDSKPFGSTMKWAFYDDLIYKVNSIAERVDTIDSDLLYNYLCLNNPFEKCVREALNA